MAPPPCTPGYTYPNSVFAIPFPAVPTHGNGVFLREMGTTGWHDAISAKRGAGAIPHNVRNTAALGFSDQPVDTPPGAHFGHFEHEFR